MDTPSFTANGLRRGFIAALPLGLGVFVYGIVFGVLSRQAGLSGAQSLSMSAFVYAGASQLLALDLWGPHMSVAAVVLTTFVVNLRHVLMGAAVAPWYRSFGPGKAYGSVFLMADENWALAMSAYARGERDGAYMVGGGLCVWLAWFAATGLGRVLTGGLADPAALGLDFAFTAVFLALLTGFWRGKADLLPWGAAAAVALVVWALVPGKWYILAGGLAGALAGSRVPPRDAEASGATAGETAGGAAESGMGGAA
ncbi:AzlC family protein [Desulfovibrio sp. X2]|uniref:AzlC family ABC transporter permease n=1 Tax=Desulfovibrio sp. X2 TaxID=941449 RepID=UPI000358E710|nr:AzlC family ABC transporter permease [Desulfovibrio sp. X2]EPR39815.1 AzlC family protein [Desulfovibrio sp. X2]